MVPFLMIFLGDFLMTIYSRLHLMRQWAKMLNDLGGDVTVVHLPEAGLHGNTHFPMSDLNNAEVAELMYDWLRGKGLD